MNKKTLLALITLIINVNSFAFDSSHIQPQKFIPLALKTTIDTSDCVQMKITKAIIVLHNGSTRGWQESRCKEGYVAYSLKTRVDIALGNGAYQWQNICCRITETYKR